MGGCYFNVCDMYVCTYNNSDGERNASRRVKEIKKKSCIIILLLFHNRNIDTRRQTDKETDRQDHRHRTLCTT